MFDFYMPVRVLAGENVLTHHADALAALGSRCLLVTGRHSAKASGVLDELTARGKIVGLPRMLPGRQMEVRSYKPGCEMVKAAFGIEEPGESCPVIPKEAVDFVLTPAVAYDERGYRMGFGGGYYDRWLEGFCGVTVGLCRNRVLREEVPVESHDAHVNAVITDTRVIRCDAQQ